MRNARAPHNSLWRLLFILYVVAVAVNYLWELAQSPLYVGMNDFSVVWWHCFVASIGDGFLVLLIFGVGWLIFGQTRWYERPKARGYALMLVSGLVISISVELVATQLARQWAYTDNMPRVPGLEIGVVPIVQMLVLPPLIFRAVAGFNRRAAARSHELTREKGRIR